MNTNKIYLVNVYIKTSSEKISGIELYHEKADFIKKALVYDRTVMEKAGNAIIGIGIGMGEDRAIEAAKQAVASPLLETSIHGATDAIINITGGSNLTLFEAEQAVEVVRAASNTDINIIFGSVINENLNDEVIVTIIATGFDKKKNQQPLFKEVGAPTRRVTPEIEEIEDDSTGTFEPTEIDIPRFLQHKNF